MNSLTFCRAIRIAEIMDLASNVEGFFRDEVDRAFRDEGLSPGTLVEHYIVQLLAELRRPSDRGASRWRCGWLAAVEAPPPRAPAAAARHRRHVALRLGVLERAAWPAAPVDVDYYIEHGRLGVRGAGARRHRLDRRSVQRRVRRAGASTSSASSARWRWSAGGWRVAGEQPGHRAPLPALAARPRAASPPRGWRRWASSRPRGRAACSEARGRAATAPSSSRYWRACSSAWRRSTGSRRSSRSTRS